MDRRGFLLGFAGALGAAAAAGTLLTPAQAAVLGQLKEGIPGKLSEELPREAAGGSTPDGTSVEPAQWGPPGPPPGRRRRRRRRVCGWRRDRWGRRVRRCWYVWR